MKSINIKLIPFVINCFWPEFIEKDKCIFIKDQMPDKIEFDSSNPDRTSIETFHSHTHILDLFENKAELKREPYFRFKHKDFILACELGKMCAQMWFQKLLLDFPMHHFRVYYTEMDNPIVRFHRVYKNEPYWTNENENKIEIENHEVIIFDSQNINKTKRQ